MPLVQETGTEKGFHMSDFRLNYLVRRGRTYYFRRAIPYHLTPSLNKDEIKISLQTTVLDVARRRCRSVTNAFEHFMGNWGNMPELPSDVIDKIIKGYFASALADMREMVDLGTSWPLPGIDVDREYSQTQTYIKQLKSELATGKFSNASIVAAEEAAQKLGYAMPSKGDDSWDILCKGVLRAKAEQNRIYSAMLIGDYDRIDPKDPLFKAPANAVFGQSTSVESPSETVGELVKKYALLKSAGTWSPKTSVDRKMVLNWFIDRVEADMPIKSITKGHVEGFRDLVMNVPAKFKQKEKYKGMTVFEAAEASTEDDRVSLTTAEKYMGTFKGFMNWCYDEEYITVVPGAKIKVPSKGGAVDARLPFSKDQLQKFIASPVYTGCKSPKRRSSAGKLVQMDALYWIPLVGLYTGMRLAEIVQMHCADLKKEGEIWYFNITTVIEEDKKLKPADTKSLKTHQSKRRIPLHHDLIRLGFVEYVLKQAKAKKGVRVFSEIEKAASGTYSDIFSKRFSTYLKGIKIKTPKTVFHSFRHNFKDAMDEAGVEDSHQDALMGHIDEKKAKNTYGSGKSLTVLAKDIEKITYPIDLSGLYSDV